jgi:ABC-type transporter Mla maintaining outer membrane lipid asymmetry ATPase subunit MlaF
MDLVAASEATSHYIAFSHVHKRFDRPVLIDCSFHLDPGRTLAIVGPPGSGKSLILQLVMGFDRPDRGNIVVAAEEMGSASAEDWERIRRKVVMIPQSAMVVESLTVNENVLYPFHLLEHYNEQNKSEVSSGLLALGSLDAVRDLRPGDLPIA